MRRREFISLLGGPLAAWPLLARAQQAKLRTIGFLGAGTASTDSDRVEAFVQRLRDLGWVEGRTITIDYRWAEGRFDRSPEIMAEFVRRKVDIIVTHANPNILAAKGATSVIPIVFPTAGDPIANGIVASLARPGGNLTGLSLLTSDLVGKRLELLREILPGLRRLTTLANVGYKSAVLEAGEVQAAGRLLGLDITTLEIRRLEDIATTMEALRGHTDALYVPTDPFLNTHRRHVSDLALSARLPTMSGVKQYVEAGGLISYGPSFLALFQRAGDYVDKILRGANPADIPIEQPTKFELVISLKTAKALGLTIAESFLLRADRVIE
jgi:putative ABC transport system substrate-binding protein